jgi:hypothetical protein
VAAERRGESRTSRGFQDRTEHVYCMNEAQQGSGAREVAGLAERQCWTTTPVELKALVVRWHSWSGQRSQSTDTCRMGGVCGMLGRVRSVEARLQRQRALVR